MSPQPTGVVGNPLPPGSYGSNRPCEVCHASESVPGFPIALCTKCRATGVRLPFPIWVIVFVAILAVIGLYGLIRIPAAMRPALMAERADIAERRGDYVQAAKWDKVVVAQFPKDGDALSDLVVSADRLGDLKTRDQALQQLRDLAANDSNQKDALDAALAQLKASK